MNLLSLKKNYKQLIVILLAFIVLFISAFNLYAYKYTEDFKIDYISERLTTLLDTDRYIEAYRLHDYITEFNSTAIQSIADASSKVEYSVQSDDPRGINTKITEKVDGNMAEIYSELTRKSATEFSLNRQYKFVDNTDFAKIDRINMQIVIGGGEVLYSANTQTVSFKNCVLKLNTLTNVDITYNSDYKVLSLTQRVFGQKVMNFNIDFNFNCTK